MKNLIIKNKVLLSLSFLLLLCILCFVYKEIFLEKSKNENTISTLKPNLNNEMIELSLFNYESIEKVGEAKEIFLQSSLKNKSDYLENVAYIMEITKDGKNLEKDDLILTYKDKRILSYDGKYELVREEFVDKNAIYNLKLIFNNEGKYEFKVYAEGY